jgi:hypothetical protein
MLGAKNTGMITVSAASARTPKTVAAARSEATSLFRGKELKSGELPSGYWLTYTNTGSMGTNHFVKVRREIDRKVFVCEAMPDSAEKAEAALAACKTLRAAK